MVVRLSTSLPTSVDGVEVLRWPAQAALREPLRRAGIPRILLLGPDDLVPEPIGIDEDWLRLPADDADLRERVQRLRQWQAVLSADEPYVDEHQHLVRGGRAVRLSAAEARLVPVLLAAVGQVVSRAELQRCLGEDAPASGAALDAAMYRLRKRLRQAGCTLRPVRGRGYALST